MGGTRARSPADTGARREQQAPNMQRARRTRSSHVGKLHLRLAQAEEMATALGFSEKQGFRLTRAIDLHFNQGDLDLDVSRPQTALQRFLKLAREWIESRGGQTAYLWVIENRRFGGSPISGEQVERETEKGVHAHILIHVPPALVKRFCELQRGWLKAAGMAGNNRRTIKGKQLPTADAVKGKFLYMLKDLRPRDLAVFTVQRPDGSKWVQLDNRFKSSDLPVYGQKAGTSRNIGKAARDRHRRLAIQ